MLCKCFSSLAYLLLVTPFKSEMLILMCDVGQELSDFTRQKFIMLYPHSAITIITSLNMLNDIIKYEVMLKKTKT